MATMTANQPALVRTQSLWDIDEQLQLLMEQAQWEESEAGAVTPETMEALKTYFAAAVQKVDRIAEFLKAQEALDRMRKDERKRLDERGKIEQSKYTRCLAMLQGFLEARGITQIKGKLNTISLCNNAQPSLKITDDKQVPEEFQRVCITVKRDWWDKWVQAQELGHDFVEFDTLQRTLAVDLAKSMTDVSDPFIDEAAVKERLIEGTLVPGADLILGKHVRVR